MAQSTQPASSTLLDALTVIPGVRWYHLADPFSPTLDALAAHFGIHPLQVEDCRHRRQTARMEEHERYSFVVIKVLADSPSGDDGRSPRAEAGSPDDLPSVSSPEPQTDDAPAPGISPAPVVSRLNFEDFDIFLGPDYLLTVDEGDSHLVSSVAARIATEPSLQNPERIAHALIDTAVDQYLPALDRLGEVINHLEDRVILRPTPPTLREIFRLKRELLEFRRVGTAMREAVNAMVRRYDALATPAYASNRELRVYYRDVYDHIVRVVEFVETYRDLLTGSLDIYLTAVANRTNEVMKILTIWGTIALPLLIITSFYGMNVKLPLQEHPHVLVILGLAMVGSAAVILYYFRRKHWF